MAVKLGKNQKINLRKQANLRKVRFDLKWSAPGVKNFDADASAFICKMVNGRPQALSEEYFVFYGNPKDPEGAVVSSGDVRQEGTDGESITIDLSKLNPKAQQIDLVVTIDKADSRRQNLGQLAGGGVSLVNDETDEVLAEYVFGKNEFTNGETVLHMASIFLEQDGWEFEPFGQGRAGISLADLVVEFGLDVE
jgi:tellurium resistance protein TerD